VVREVPAGLLVLLSFLSPCLVLPEPREDGLARCSRFAGCRRRSGCSTGRSPRPGRSTKRDRSRVAGDDTGLSGLSRLRFQASRPGLSQSRALPLGHYRAR
jgi:hypothetical protein